MRSQIFALLFLGYHANVQAANNTQSDVEVIEVEFQNNKAAYTVLQREDFIHSAQSVSDVLRAINGIQIRQISGIGNPVSVSIRGSDSKQVKVYIDGQLINDSQFGGYDLNQLPVEQIQSIEVSKSQSSGTGATPIGGVIRINTYRPDKAGYRVSAEAGSFGYYGAAARVNGKFEDHLLSASVQHQYSKNDYDYLVPQSFDDSNISATEALRNNEFEKSTFSITDSFQSQYHNISVNAQYTDQNKRQPNYQNNSPENHSELNAKTWRVGYQHQMNNDLVWLPHTEWSLFYEDKQEHYQYLPNLQINRSNHYDSDKYQGSLQATVEWHSWQLQPYIDYQQHRFSSRQNINGQNVVCNGINSCDLSAKLSRFSLGSRINWQSNSLPLDLFAQFNYSDEDSQNTPLNAQSGTRVDQNEQYETYELGSNYQLDKLSFSVSGSKAVRTPTLFELYGDRGAFKGNANLQPEQANTISLSTQYQSQQLNMTAAAYHKDLNNSIVAIFNSSNVGSYTNVSDATLTGVELQADFKLNQQWLFNFQVNLLDSETQSEFKAFNEKKLPGIYHQQYHAGVKYSPLDALAISWKIALDEDLYFNRSNVFDSQVNGTTGTPADRLTHQLSLNWELGKHNINLLVDNIFDNTYQDLANRPSQGRSIQLKYSFEEF